MRRRRRNFIPGLTRKQSTFATVGGALLVGAVAYFLLRGRKKLKRIYDHDETIYAIQGMPVSIRLPRGTYLAVSPDVLLQAQQDIGDETHVVLTPLKSGVPEYTITTVLAEQGTSQTFPIKIVARPPEEFERNRRQRMPRSLRHGYTRRWLRRQERRRRNPDALEGSP